MRGVLWCGVMFAVAAMAGCIDNDDATEPVADAAGPYVPEPRFELDVSGEAGEWLFVFLPYVNATGQIQGANDWDVQTEPATDEPHHVLWLSPTWVWGDWGRFDFFTSGQNGPHYVDSGSFEDDASHSWGLGSSDPPLGYNFALASDAPWRLRMELTLDSGVSGFGEPVMIRGNGTTGTYHDEDLVPIPVEPAGSYQVEGTFDTPGWHLVSFLNDPVQPPSVRDYVLQIPEERIDTVGYRYGVQAGGGFASSSSMYAALGVFDGAAGDWRAEVTRAEASWDLPLMVFEMPGEEEWPTWAKTPYRIWAEPFHDGLTPPPPVTEHWVVAR